MFLGFLSSSAFACRIKLAHVISIQDQLMPTQIVPHFHNQPAGGEVASPMPDSKIW